MPPTLRQLALQAAAALLVAVGAWVLRDTLAEVLSWGVLAAAAGATAGAFAWATRQPVWWRFIHTGFLPLAWAVGMLNIPPGWFLAAFIALLLVFRGALTGRVPLYLSNDATAAVLADLARKRRVRRLADLGAGTGTIVRRLARTGTPATLTGVENAPLTWLVGWGLQHQGRQGRRIDWRYGSLWDTDLAPFDLVYAFLSPEPMPALWEKARAEMVPGTLLVSNSFAIPDVTPSAVLEVDDRRRTHLYCYSIPARP